MVKVKLTLQELEALNTHFISFMQHRKVSSIIDYQDRYSSNRDSTGKISLEYTTAVIMVLLADKINIAVLQKLLNWQGKRKKEGTLSLDVDCALVLYHSLQNIPIPDGNIWLWQLANNIIAQLDAQLQVDELMARAANARIVIE